MRMLPFLLRSDEPSAEKRGDRWEGSYTLMDNVITFLLFFSALISGTAGLKVFKGNSSFD